MNIVIVVRACGQSVIVYVAIVTLVIVYVGMVVMVVDSVCPIICSMYHALGLARCISFLIALLNSFLLVCCMSCVAS